MHQEKFDPLISIIIPTRNRKGLLLDAVLSVLSQTYSNLQVIIHDNNSVDGSKEYIYKNVHDKRVEYYRSEVDLSMTENWNKAFSYINGTYFVRLDDDNVISNDFIESCIGEIKKNNLNVIIFSPVIIHLKGKIFTIFPENKGVFVLNKFQIFYLDYFNLTDSNNALYEVSLIRKIFTDGNVYKTTLPDRHMDYCLIDKIKDIRIGLSTEIKGITRYDYRHATPADYKLSFFDYNKLILDDILKLNDCKNNFWMHRISAVEYFLRNCEDTDLKNFFNKKITNPIFYKTTMKLGHIYMAGSAFSIEEIFTYNRLALDAMIEIILHPFCKLEGRGIILNAVSIIRNSAISNLKSLANVIMKKTRKQDQFNKSKGDALVGKLISGEIISNYTQFCQRGELSHILDKINELQIDL